MTVYLWLIDQLYLIKQRNRRLQHNVNNLFRPANADGRHGHPNKTLAFPDTTLLTNDPVT